MGRREPDHPNGGNGWLLLYGHMNLCLRIPGTSSGPFSSPNNRCHQKSNVPFRISTISNSNTGHNNATNTTTIATTITTTTMNLASRVLWSLVGSLACLGTVINAAGVLEIDVVFPRPNETYAPKKYFPIVFALQNAKMAKLLEPEIYSFIRNGPDFRSAFGDRTHDLTYANYSSEPYFVYHHVSIEDEGRYQLFSTITWQSCNVSGDEVSIIGGDINLGFYFNISKGAQEVDLVAATANDKTCLAENAVALNVTDQTYDVTPTSWDDRRPTGTCAVLDSSSPTPTANPCQVKVDTAAAASMSASLAAALCRGLNPPADCPKEDNAVQLLAVAGVASFAATFGAIGFLLA